MAEGDALRERLARIGAEPDERIDIADAALTLAAFDRPRVRLARYRDHLAELARDTAAASADLSGAVERAAALARVIAVDHGYQGDSLTYDDQQNANLMRVIDRRKGLPVALGVLYLHCARRQGWDMTGLNFPGHFLLRLQAADGRVVVDPFERGRQLQTGEMRALLRRIAGPSAELAPAHYAEVGARQVLLRLQNNIKSRALQAGETARAIEVLERMVLLAPSAALLRHELGGLAVEVGNLGAAIANFEAFLALTDDPAARHGAAATLQRLRRRLN